MKIAALYDIHGNLPALNALLEELADIQPDVVVIGGDIVSGPMPAQTLECLLQYPGSIRWLRGNGDREVVTAFDKQPLNRRYLPAISDALREEIEWTARQLTTEQRDVLAALPEQLEISVEGLGTILFCHATPRNDEEIFTPLTSPERMATMFSNVKQDIVVCGHTHHQFERRVGDLHIINAGSVGMPFANQPGAYWLLLSPQGYEFRRTPYDGVLAAQEIYTSGYRDAQKFVEESVLHPKEAAKAMEFFEQIGLAHWSEEDAR